MPRLKRVTALGWLVLPSAIVLSSVAAGLAGVAGWNADRLLERTAIVAVIAALLMSLEYSRQVDERSIVRFLSFPVLMALLWLGGRELGLISSFWMFDSGASIALWSAAAVAAFMLCWILTPQIHSRAAAAGFAAIAVLAVILIAQAAPPIVFPTYSLRDASRDLQQHLPVDRPVRTVRAASLFLENEIKYHELPRQDQQIGGLVIFEHSGARKFLDPERATHLFQVQAYPLTVSPRYQAADGKPETPIVRVYRVK